MSFGFGAKSGEELKFNFGISFDFGVNVFIGSLGIFLKDELGEPPENKLTEVSAGVTTLPTSELSAPRG